MIKNLIQKGYFKFKRFYTGFDTTSWIQVILLIVCVVLVVAFVIGIFAIILLWPLALAWAINSIFLTGIPYTFGTWAAFIVMAWVLQLVTSR